MDVTDSPSEPGGPLPAAPAGRRRTIVMIGAVVAVLAVVLVAVALASDDDRTMFGRHDVAASRRVERACQQWLDDEARPTPDAAPGWCDHMGDWMYEQMASGRRGSEMWRDPSAMRDTCVAAMGSHRPRVSDPEQWCRDMVDSMRRRAGDGGWRDWMRNPSMMGR
jgi:hypothetical protein